MSRSFLAFLFFCAVTAAGEQEKPLWLVVGPAALVEPLSPLVQHRREQGLDVLVVTGNAVPEALGRAGRPPDYLLLVGDDANDALEAAWRLPSRRLPLYRWRAVQEKTYASDAVWVDRDGDLLPDIPVGRIPARTAEQVRIAVAKTLAYESRGPALEDLRLVAWAGAPGYGGVVDAMATTLLVNTVRQRAPAWASPWLISADARQPLCGWPSDHPAQFGQALRKGSLLGFVAAHGNADGIFSMTHEGRSIWLGHREVRRFLGGDAPTAPLVLLACNGAEFGRPMDSLAEAMLFLRGGPVATIGATTESHPLTNYFTGICMLRALAGEYGASKRLGDLWLRAQRNAAKQRNPLIEAVLRDVEGRLDASIDTARLRSDQQRMYVLLGDPALRLPLPDRLEAKLERTSTGWTWTATRVEGATRLHVGFKSFTPPAALVPSHATADTRRELFAQANAAESFGSLAVLEGKTPWRGVVTEPGRIRLVAIGPALLRVAILEAR